MGKHQRAETMGLVSLLVSSVLASCVMLLCVLLIPGSWLDGQWLFIVASGIVAALGVVSFCIGYINTSKVPMFGNGRLLPIRRMFEIFALSVVYAATLFLTSYVMLVLLGNTLGGAFSDYIVVMCAVMAGVGGYATYVQAELMDAKTLASVLPFFMISGVALAGLTSDDPDWFTNNFSQLGDRTTFAARLFNSTLILAGVCMIIISYFAISELVTTHHLTARLEVDRLTAGPTGITHFKARMVGLGVLLTLSGVVFIGVGAFPYSPNPVMHNVFAHSLPIVMTLLFVGLPWLVPQFPKAMYVVTLAAIGVAYVSGLFWLLGMTTLTNVEAVFGLVYMGWFIVFSRQIAAIEADRLQAQSRYEDSRQAQSERLEPNDQTTQSAAKDGNTVLDDSPQLADESVAS